MQNNWINSVMKNTDISLRAPPSYSNLMRTGSKALRECKKMLENLISYFLFSLYRIHNGD